MPRYHGLDLPVHEPEAEALLLPGRYHLEDEWEVYKAALEHLQRRSRDRILREMRVPLAIHCFDSLRHLLNTADELFQRVSESCQARTVDYEWGLYKIPDHIQGKGERFKEYIPKGMLLVADVTIMRTILPLSPDQEDIVDIGIHEY